MGEFTAGIVVLGTLFVLAVVSRWGRPKDRVDMEQDEKRAIEKQGELLAAQEELHKPKTMHEVADEFNKTFK